jgi:anthranilate synthase component 1
MLVRSEDDELFMVALAGTRPRGKNPEEDKKLAKELLQDSKDLAEHMMLVDLARNDVGRVSEIGTVNVTRLKHIVRYSHVMHIASDVRGRLAKDKTIFDAFASCFPHGTVSGAPKIRAMEIIAELEKSARGPYAGAIGYFGFNNNMDNAICIRTIVIKRQFAYIQAGAGIVADSVPELEWQETINKMKGVIMAL